MHIYVIFNPNQEENLLGYKVVDNSKYLNSVSSPNTIFDRVINYGLVVIFEYVLYTY